MVIMTIMMIIIMVMMMITIREGFTKKSRCSFGFCPNQGEGGPCPNFLSTFHKLYMLGQFGDGEGERDPYPSFLAHWRSKKVVQAVQIRGRGRGNLDKIQKNSYFYRETVPESLDGLKVI